MLRKLKAGARSLYLSITAVVASIMLAIPAFAGDSDDSWNAIVFFGRRIGRAMSLNLGYRYFTDDVTTSDGANPYAWDMDLTGPVVGYVWQFGNSRFPN